MKANGSAIVLAFAAVALMGANAGGQNPQAFGPGGRPAFVDPAVAYAGYAGCDACDAHGNSISGSCPPSYGGGPGGGYGMGWGASGGYDQCGPHYYDISADALYWKRDRSADPPVATTSLGVGGPIVLSTNDIDLDYETAFRLTGRLDLGPISFVEALFFGELNHYDAAQVTGSVNSDPPPLFQNDLYSLFSDFGNDPLIGEADEANLHRIEYGSELNNAEINYRWYWLCDYPGVTGTVLLGARYTRLTERFVFHSRIDGPPEVSLDYFVKTKNDLVGAQAGGDAAICLLQGFRVVGEGKVGIYNNSSRQDTLVTFVSVPPTQEWAKDNDVAFIGEASVSVVADILPSLSIRGGYQILYLESVALAGNNLSSDPPGTVGVRTPFLDNSSQVLYHGFNAGVELVW